MAYPSIPGGGRPKRDYPIRSTGPCAALRCVQSLAVRPSRKRGRVRLLTITEEDGASRTGATTAPEVARDAPDALSALRGRELHDGGLGGPRPLLVLRAAAGRARPVPGGRRERRTLHWRTRPPEQAGEHRQERGEAPSRVSETGLPSAAFDLARYGLARKIWVLEVALPWVPLPVPTANWLTFQIRFAVEGSGVAAA